MYLLLLQNLKNTSEIIEVKSLALKVCNYA